MGKGYMEFKIIQDATYLFIGVGSGTYNATYSGSGSMMIYYDGVIYPGPVSTGLGANNVNGPGPDKTPSNEQASIAVFNVV